MQTPLHVVIPVSNKEENFLALRSALDTIRGPHLRAGKSPPEPEGSARKHNHSLENRLRGSKRGSERGKNEPSGPVISLGPALVASSLCRGQEKRTMYKPEIQIGNWGLGLGSRIRRR